MSRKGIQLCYPFEEKRLAKWQPPYIVQPKYDGERCRAVPVGDSYLLLSSEENPFFSVPHINEALKALRFTNLEFDGELYDHNRPFEQIHGIVSRTRNLHPAYQDIRYHIFDIVGEEEQGKRSVGLSKLSQHFNSKSLQATPFEICNSLDDITRAYDKFVNEGYEGIIVRNIHASYIRKRSPFVMKFKPKKEDIYTITGYKEEIDIHGAPKGRLGAIICMGDDGTQFAVGTGLTDYDRENLWNQGKYLIGKQVKVKYQHLTAGKKVPRFPVFVEVIE